MFDDGFFGGFGGSPFGGMGGMGDPYARRRSRTTTPQEQMLAQQRAERQRQVREEQLRRQKAAELEEERRRQQQAEMRQTGFHDPFANFFGVPQQRQYRRQQADIPPALARDPRFARLSPREQDNVLRLLRKQQKEAEYRRQQEEEMQREAEEAAKTQMQEDEDDEKEQETDEPMQHDETEVEAEPTKPTDDEHVEADMEPSVVTPKSPSSSRSPSPQFQDCVEEEKDVQSAVVDSSDDVTESEPDVEPEVDEVAKSLAAIQAIMDNGQLVEERWASEAFVARTPDNTEEVTKARAFYSEGLLQCVIKLDGVDSHGNMRIRQARKAAVIHFESKVEELKAFGQEHDSVQ